MRIRQSAQPGHHEVTFTWAETDHARPAHDVLVRLIAMTDQAHDDGDLSRYLMSRQPDGDWELTLRLPSALRSSYQICPIRDEPVRGHPSEERFAEIIGMGVPDPDNPAVLAAGTTYGNPGMASIVELPGALPQSWHARRPDVARGTMTRHVIEAEGKEPAVVHVYLPAGIPADAVRPPLVIAFDASCWVALGVSDMLDNLIHDGVARPMIVVGVESIHGARRLVGLTHPEIFEPFLHNELLPWIHARWKVTSDPAESVLAGQSLGALTAAYVARAHSDRFGWVIGQSTSAWWPGDDNGGLSGQQVVDAYATGPLLPVRFFLEAGAWEGELLQSVRVMRDMLVDQQYDVGYREYEGGHDYACWRGGLADGLIAALTPSRRVDETLLPMRPA